MSSFAAEFASAKEELKQAEPALLADVWRTYLQDIRTKGVERSLFHYEAPRPVLLQFAKQLEKLEPTVLVRIDPFGVQILPRRTVYDTPTFFDDPSFDKSADQAFAGGITPALRAFLKWKFHHVTAPGGLLLWVRDPDSASTQYNLCHGHVPMQDDRIGTFHINPSHPSHVLPCWHVEQSHSLFSKLYPAYSFSKSWPADGRVRVFGFNGRELADNTVTPTPVSTVAP